MKQSFQEFSVFVVFVAKIETFKTTSKEHCQGAFRKRDSCFLVQHFIKTLTKKDIFNILILSKIGLRNEGKKEPEAYNSFYYSNSFSQYFLLNEPPYKA